jgi:hypothetical protein
VPLSNRKDIDQAQNKVKLKIEFIEILSKGRQKTSVKLTLGWGSIKNSYQW